MIVIGWHVTTQLHDLHSPSLWLGRSPQRSLVVVQQNGLQLAGVQARSQIGVTLARARGRGAVGHCALMGTVGAGPRFDRAEEVRWDDRVLGAVERARMEVDHPWVVPVAE